MSVFLLLLLLLELFICMLSEEVICVIGIEALTVSITLVVNPT